MKRTAIIMAGGSGERFWPLSRINKPKQLLKLSSPDKTMLEEAIERISPIIPPEDIFIITSSRLLEPIRNTLKEIPPENVVAEPYKRNTAPCLALGAAFILAKYSEQGIRAEEISIAVLTADHIVLPSEGFRKTVSSALDYVENNKALATIGIPPARPETGYGYIKVESPFDNNPEFSEIKPVLRFLEKPDSLTAQKFISTGKHFWNSGMFFWRLDTFIEEMTACLPDVGLKIKDMSEKYIRKTNIAHSEPLHTIDGIFELMPNISIDYGLMEKAGDVVVARALFEWDDIGSWDSLSRTKPKDDRGNVVEGVVCLVDSNNSIIINSTEGNKTIVSALGLDGIVIVATDDAIVVCPKDRVQDVKKCVEEIRNAYQEKWI